MLLGGDRMSISPISENRMRRPVFRPDGVTPSERYLRRLCEKSFLSLWSYPSIFRDQGCRDGREGKEVCDLLVVFKEHVLIFSDKFCAFPNTGDLRLDWCRWFRRAVWASATQLRGAERWLINHPHRLFLDRACTQPFPIDVPAPQLAKIHLIVVAHDCARVCRERLGGSGSLMIDPKITGTMHFDDPKSAQPFTVGQLYTGGSFVHILDDTSLEILIRALDTVPDFFAYLQKKEAFVRSGRLVFACGEEDLLAFYLHELNAEGVHDFVVPEGIQAVSIDEGLWKEFETHPQRIAQLKANEVSYTWDRLIETFNKHILAGTWHDDFDATVRDREKAVRLLAGECRTARRLLAKALLDLIYQSVADSQPVQRRRIMLPFRSGGPFFVFQLLPKMPNVSEQDYREVRGKLLEAVCMVVRLRYPEATDVVGIATETGNASRRSEDVIFLDGTLWTAEMQAEAESLQRDLGLLTKTTGPFHYNEKEYPNAISPLSESAYLTPRKLRSVRNSPCPCGSGRKYKRCCGGTS